MIGGSSIVKSFDKITKGFVVQLTEKDTQIRYPKYSISFLHPAALLSADFDR